MKVTVFGAAQEVTGSCYLLEAADRRILVDCGLFQGSRRLEKNNFIPDRLSAAPIDAVILTHGHLDHCGRLPLLFKSVRGCPILATSGTIDIAKLILDDAAKIQEDDVARENRKRRRRDQKLLPLFSREDVERIHRFFREVSYNQWISISEQIRARFVEAGHIIGSASIELEIGKEDKARRLIFSGDLGPRRPMLQRPPAAISSADVVFMESTYGDRDHRSLENTKVELKELVQSAVRRRGKIFIPTFAVGRAQQILCYFAELFRTRVVPPFPIYLDSPMALAATDIYVKHHQLLRDDLHLLDSEEDLRNGLSTLIPTASAEESKALNTATGPCAILSGAGMCNAGRIMHHLRHGLSSPENVVLIVGYQAKGSTGRQLIEGATEVKIFGDTVRVRATVRSLGGFSAHAGQTELVDWLEPIGTNQNRKPRIFLTHGENNSMIQLSYKIRERLGLTCSMPRQGEVIILDEQTHPQDRWPDLTAKVG